MSLPTLPPWTDSLVERIYDAIVVPAVWEEVCQTISSNLGAKVWIEMGPLSNQADSPERILVRGGRAQPAADRADWPRRGEVPPDLALNAPDKDGSVKFTRSSPGLDSGFCDLMTLDLAPSTSGFAPILFVGRECESPRFGKADEAGLQIIAHHLCFAATMRLRSASRAPFATEYMQALDHFSTGCVLVDAGSAVIFANRAAKGILRQGWPVSLRGGRLHSASPSSDHDLQRALRTACGDGYGQNRIPSELNLSDTQSVPFVLAVLPLGDANPLVGSVSVVRAAIYFLTPQNPVWSEVVGKRLINLYGLSEAQSKVAWDLACGRAPDEIASARGRSTHTVRAQIRDIFGRSGATRAGQLQAMRHVFAAPPG